MPRYEVYLDDESSYPTYAENEEVIKTEIFYPYDNRVHSPEQSAGQLQHTRMVITTRYIYEQTGFIGPMEYQWTKQAYDAYRGHSNSRRVASAPRASPKRGNRKSSMAKAKTSRSKSSDLDMRRCPKGYYYDSKRKMCVRIKGRKQNASKKKFWNGKYR